MQRSGGSRQFCIYSTGHVPVPWATCALVRLQLQCEDPQDPAAHADAFVAHEALLCLKFHLCLSNPWLVPCCPSPSMLGGKPWVAWSLGGSKSIRDGDLGTCLAALLLLSVMEHRGREELCAQESGGEYNWGQFAPCSQSFALCPRMGDGGSYKEHIRGRAFAVALGRWCLPPSFLSC